MNSLTFQQLLSLLLLLLIQFDLIIAQKKSNRQSQSLDFKIIYPKNLIDGRHNDSFCNDDGSIIFLDYSLIWNAYVTVCQNNLIDVEPINYSQTTRLNVLQFQVKKLEHFAFDWLHGLLYYSTVMDGINVIDLKKNELATFPIYRATGSNTVNGLIVRPDLTKLMWLETYGTDTIMMESDQNGKRSSPLFNISRTIYTDLYYDPYGNRYLLVMPQTQATKISGMIIIDFNEKTILKSINFEINFSRQKNWQTKNVRIRDDWLYFFVKQSQYIGHIYRCSISSQNYTHGINDSISIIIDNIHLTSCIVVTGDNSRSPFILYDPMIRKETNWKKHCNGNVCVRQDIDFCIPINQTHSQCTNGEVFEINKNHNEMLIYKIIISVLASIIILILIIYFLFFSKQRARFYQIRLKKLNRVESSKLQMKTPATNEIAE